MVIIADIVLIDYIIILKRKTDVYQKKRWARLNKISYLK